MLDRGSYCKIKRLVLHPARLSLDPFHSDIKAHSAEKSTSALVTREVWGAHGLPEMISAGLLTCALSADIEDKGLVFFFLGQKSPLKTSEISKVWAELFQWRGPRSHSLVLLFGFPSLASWQPMGKGQDWNGP